MLRKASELHKVDEAEGSTPSTEKVKTSRQEAMDHGDSGSN